MDDKLICSSNTVVDKSSTDCDNVDLQESKIIENDLFIRNVSYDMDLFPDNENHLILSVESNVTNSKNISDLSQTITESDKIANCVDLEKNLTAPVKENGTSFLAHNIVHRESNKNIIDPGRERKPLFIENINKLAKSNSDQIVCNENGSTYVINGSDKFNGNESISMGELSAITTQNFNLINNEFDQNKMNFSVDVTQSYSKIGFDDTICSNSDKLIVKSENVDCVSDYKCNKNSDNAKFVDSGHIFYEQVNLNIPHEVTHNSFVNHQLNGTYTEMINTTISGNCNETESNTEIEKNKFVFPTNILSENLNLNLENESGNVIDPSNNLQNTANQTPTFIAENLATDCNKSSFDSNIINTLTKSNLKRSNTNESSVTHFKKVKKGISFDKVSVYYFPRTQGFTCIPSQGGSTLGMSWNHSHSKVYSLGEHASEQRRTRRQNLTQQFTQTWNDVANTSSEDTDSEEQLSDSEVDLENYNFLQPIATKERRAMLRASGIRKIESSEKDECRQIRQSREFCGCSCQAYCDPDTCTCSQAGIKCQVDRLNFPCSCSRDGCVNPNGRVEFNPLRVKTHYINTLMRMELEKKQSQEQMNASMDNMPVIPNLELERCIKSNSLMNLNCANDLQSYYQQTPHPSTQPYNVAITSSCFSFNYNQFFPSSYQQSTPLVSLESRAIDYHSSTGLYDPMQMLQFNNSNEHFGAEISDVETSFDEANCVGKNEIAIMKDFADLLDGGESESDPITDGVEPHSEASTPDEDNEVQNVGTNMQDAHQEISVATEEDLDLGEMIKTTTTIIEAVT